MTTTVKIEAHCAESKEVLVVVWDSGPEEDDLLEDFKLQDGEKAERYVYDARYITVREIEKEKK